MSRLLTSGGQSIGASASASVLSMKDLLIVFVIYCLPTKCKLFEYKDLCFAVDILGASVTIHVFDKC